MKRILLIFAMFSSLSAFGQVVNPPSGGSGGTVTSVSGTANQVSVASPTTTPVISLTNNTALPGSPTAATAANGTNTTQIATTAFVAQVASSINATAQAGADIVAKINAALVLGPDVFIPAGTYTLSSCAGWTLDTQAGDPWNSFHVGVALPTGSHLHGAGEGLTVINVTRLNTDPPCSLFANATRVGTGNNPNIEIDHMTINWTDQNTGTPQSSIFEIAGSDKTNIHDVEMSGNPNRLLIISDVTRVAVHDNNMNLNTTSATLGNSAVSWNRFQSGTPYLMDVGSVYNNIAVDTGDPTSFGMSMFVLSQSNAKLTGNICDLVKFVSSPNLNAYNGNCVETGDDNLGNLPAGLQIQGNHWYGGVRLPAVSTDYSSNLHEGGYGILASYASTSDTTTAARTNIHGNILLCPGTGINCGILVNGNSGQGYQSVIVSENDVEDGGIAIATSGSIGGGPNCVVENNRVRNTPSASLSGGTVTAAIGAYGCSGVGGNFVQNPDADAASGNDASYGIAIGNASAAVSTTYDYVSNNKVIDDQQTYSTGTVCSVASVSSTTCLTTGTSRYLYSAGATWSPAWSNRYIFIASVPIMIRGFYGVHYIELESAIAFVGSGTAYSLTWSMNGGYYLGSPIINFTGNFGYVAQQFMRAYPSDGMITDVSGTVITNLANNNFISARQAVCSSTAVCKYPYYNQSPIPQGGVSCTQATCASTATALYTMPNIATGSGGVSGIQFKVEAEVDCTSAVASSTATLQIGWTDVGGFAQTVTAGTATCTTLGASSMSSLSRNITMSGNSAVTYKITQASSPNFQARVMIYQETTN